MTTPTTFNHLITMLGRDGAQRFLAFARPQIQQCQQDLLTSLHQHDWDSAAAIAHRFKATAYLYRSTHLVEQLDTIMDKHPPTLQQAAFADALAAELQQIEQAIQRFMANI
jgi:hypothetical protein